MTRDYDASRRRRAAEETRRKILQAALKLHWDGVTEYGRVAEEAGCSVPTLRKHFPTKESLFQDCTRTFADSVTFPDLEALGAIPSRTQRLEACVSELCRIHEVMFGYAWNSAYLRRESPTLDSVMSAYEELADAMAGLLDPEDRTREPVIRGLLDFLTYRALRLSGQLSPDRAREELIATLRPLVLGSLPKAE